MMQDQVYRVDGTTQTVSVSGTSAAITNAVGTQTRAIRVAVTTDCHIKVATTPVATTSDPFIPSGTVEYFRITPGQKVAFIQNSASGTAYVTECHR